MTAGPFKKFRVNSAPFHAVQILSHLESSTDVVIDGDTGVIFIREPLVHYLELASFYYTLSVKGRVKRNFVSWLDSHLKDPLIKEAMLFTHQSLERTSKKAAIRYGL